MPHPTSFEEYKYIFEDDTVADVSSDFSNLKVSAVRKAWQVNKYIDKVTIGPNSKLGNDDALGTENLENEKNADNIASGKDSNSSATKNADVSTRSTITFSKKKLILENELSRREEVRKKMKQRYREMQELESHLRKEMAMMQEILALKRESEEAKELERLEAEEERLAQQNEMRRKHEQQLTAQRIQERKEKLVRESEEHRRNRQYEELVECIGPLRLSFRDNYRDINNMSKSCKDRSLAVATLSPLANKLKELNAQMESINEKARAGDLTIADASMAQEIVQQSEQELSKCKTEIARIDALYEKEIAQREEAMRQAELVVQAEARLAAGAENQSESEEAARLSVEKQIEESIGNEKLLQANVPSPTAPSNDENLYNAEHGGTDSSSIETATEENDGSYSDYESLQVYMNTHTFLSNYAAQYRDLTQATSMKKFRFECQKAINIPVNAISSVTGSHIKEKYETLRSLLMGKSTPNILQHPQGAAFCKDILAKKIVSQGETLISSKPEMAFPIAAITIALWNDYPDFGELLLAHFHRTCPYLLPIFLPRLQGQTNEEYYRSLGYKYNEEGVVEKQDKYLTRISGLMRLYASIIMTPVRQGSTKPHPHGIHNAWRWLAIVLNAEPRADMADVCATLIFDMLEVAGNSLWQAYPRQFPKMLLLLSNQYYTQMMKVAGTGGGPMSRLEQFLNNSLANKRIPPPERQLPPNFW